MNALAPFQLHRPTDLEEALHLRSSLGPEASWYAGGTELLLAMKMGVLRPRHLIDVKRLPELRVVKISSQGTLHVGGAVTYQQLLDHGEVRRGWPTFSDLVENVGNARVRAVGTVGGNLAFAEPRSDPATYLLAVGGSVETRSLSGTRCLTLDELVVGPYSTGLREDELLTGVEIPSTAAGYVKFQLLERPSLGVAVSGRIEGGRFAGAPRVVIGAGTLTPTLSKTAGAHLDGASLQPSDSRVRDAGRAAAREIDTVDDASGSSRYKARLIEALLPRAVAMVREGDS